TSNVNVSLHFGGVPVRLARRSRRACPWISGGHKEAPTKRGLKCHLPEGNPSLARRVALTMRAFAARVTRFFGRSTNRPVVSPDSCEARGVVGWLACLPA